MKKLRSRWLATLITGALVASVDTPLLIRIAGCLLALWGLAGFLYWTWRESASRTHVR